MVRRVGRSVAVIGAVVAAVSAWPAVAAGAPVAMCVPSAANTAITTPQSNGTCPSGKTKRSVADAADLTAARARISALEAKLAGVTRTTVNGRPTVRFSGVNLQVVNGAGTTTAVNGLGNLIVGYNGSPGTQTGSHNLLVGRFHTATSWGSVLGGEENTSTAPETALFGYRNRATGSLATVLGGMRNWSEGRISSITAGCDNAAGPNASISGTAECDIEDHFQSVTGGRHSVASGDFALVSGGHSNRAMGVDSAVSGGQNNAAAGVGAWVGGGEFNGATARYGSVVGGLDSFAGGWPSGSGSHSVVVGGASNIARGSYSAILGGVDVVLEEDYTHSP